MVSLNSLFKNTEHIYFYFSVLLGISRDIPIFQRFFTHFDICRLLRHLSTKMTFIVDQINVIFSGESESAIKNGGSHLRFLSPPSPTARGWGWEVEFGIIGCPPSRRINFMTNIFSSDV